MKIYHNIALLVDKDSKRDFENVGIDLENGFSNFKIDEADIRWPTVNRLSRKYEAIDTITTKFSASELKKADHLRMVSTWHHGYPEPSNNFDYLQDVYDLSNYCSSCGKGLIQSKAFSFSKEPKWGSKDILQLNWIFDEFFVKPEIWESIFKPGGVNCREVLHVKSKNKLETVVQLIIPEKKIFLALDDYPFEICMICKSKKYLPISRGYFPSLKEGTDALIFKTVDFFGSGKSGYKAIIVSNNLYNLIIDNKLKGVKFIPLESLVDR